MKSYTVLPATMDQLLDDGDMVKATTTSDKGVFKRAINVAQTLTNLEGWVVTDKHLKAILANCNATAFPNQDPKSHTMWGSRKLKGLIKNGVLAEVDA